MQRRTSHRPAFEQLEDRCVPTTVTNVNPNGAGSLPQAILDTPSGGTVDFLPDLGTISLPSALVISKNLTINGGSGVTLTANSSLLFNIDDTTATVINVTLIGLRLTGVSTGGNGGAIFNAENLAVLSCTITGSSALNGGGIYNNGTLNLTNSAVTGNTAQRGGGLVNVGATLVTRSTVSGNSASIDGGGAYNATNRTMSIVSSTFSGNSAGNNGGGIFSDLGATTSLSNSTLSGNVAANAGGGILTSINNVLTLTNCTVTGNRADSDGNAGAGLQGGGVFAGVPTTTTLSNTIVAGNVKGIGVGTPDDLNAVATGSNNLIGDTVSSAGLTNNVNNNKVGNNGSGTIDINSVLNTTLAANGGLTQTHTLVAGSLALNAGNNTLATGLANDQRGAPFIRIFGSTIDIGAYERQTVAGLSLIVDTLVDENDLNYSAGDLSLREAIGLANGNVGADTITFAAALNNNVIGLTSGELRVMDSVTMTGPGANVLAVTGNNASRILRVDDGQATIIDVSLRGLKLLGGNSGAGVGGAILNQETLSVADCILVANTAQQGGGIHNNGALTLTDSTLQANSAVYGGGLANSDTAAGATIGFCTFLSNSTFNGGDGGGIYNSVAMTLANSTLSGNTATANGGGAFNFGTMTVLNSTFSGNTAAALGGGFANGFSGNATILNSTLTANRAAGGGGVRNGSGPGTPVIRLFNTLVAGNLNTAGTTPSDVTTSAATDAISSNNLIGDAASAGVLVNGARGNIVGINGAGTRPIATILSAALANNGGPTSTHALVQNSAALGSGSSTVAGYVPYDQREAARDSGPDIGTYEVNHPLAPVGVPSDNVRTFAPQPSPDANTAFIKGLYQTTVLRDADAGGLAFWTSQLNAGKSRDQVAYGFVNSLENRSNQVTFFYRYFLNRGVDANGLAFHVARLQSGVDEGTVMTGFILSNEFSGQNNNTAFVNLMYYAILSRPAEVNGFNFWMNQLTSGANDREQVVNGFLRSNEGIGRVVSSYFLSYLKRAADANSLNSFTVSLNNGTTFGTVAATLLGSPEFFGLAAGNL